MPRSKCLSALAPIKCQIAILDQLTAATNHAANSLLGTIGTFQCYSLIYDSPRRRKGGC
jgi:hypothetical protein